MTEQERAFWQAVYQQTLGVALGSGPVGAEQLDSVQSIADDAVRALRVSEARAIAHAKAMQEGTS